MLTRSDQTVADCLDVLDLITPLGLRHIGFKDVGVPPDVLRELTRRISAIGATSYMEVVSTSAEACLRAARVAREIGVDRLLGGTEVDQVLEILAGSAVRYLPFPGRPFDHPTKLAGSAATIEADCRRFDLVRAARRATPGCLLVAGGVCRPDQIRALAEAGADAFTVGSAVFDGSFSPRLGSLRSQLRAVVDACR